MKIIAFVPIKLHNERLSHKNLLSLSDGKPLLGCILDTLSACEKIDEIYVFCSDPSISHWLPHGVHLILRDAALDSAQTTANDLATAFAVEVPADFYIMTHATSPLITVKSIERGIQAVQSGCYDSAFSAVKTQDFFWQDEVPLNYDPSFVQRTQDLPVFYKETSGFYIFTRQLILENHRRIGFCPQKIEVSPIEALDIDEQQDFWIADAVRQYCMERNIFYGF